jgi:uncharacterized membrane protein YdfJ with MMPL/SSD domain
MGVVVRASISVSATSAVAVVSAGCASIVAWMLSLKKLLEPDGWRNKDGAARMDRGSGGGSAALVETR